MALSGAAVVLQRLQRAGGAAATSGLGEVELERIAERDGPCPFRALRLVGVFALRHPSGELTSFSACLVGSENPVAANGDADLATSDLALREERLRLCADAQPETLHVSVEVELLSDLALVVHPGSCRVDRAFRETGGRSAWLATSRTKSNQQGSSPAPPMVPKLARSVPFASLWHQFLFGAAMHRSLDCGGRTPLPRLLP